MKRMPWETKSVENQRKAFIEAVNRSRNFSEVCRQFGITRRTGYKWLERYRNGESLNDQSRRPKHFGNKTEAKIEQSILEVRNENPGWGANTIHTVLERSGIEYLPSVRTVNNILKRNGCISEEESLKRKPFVRFEKDFCNEMWQGDFKGEFRMKNDAYCYPLDILDDHSRFCIALEPFPDTKDVVISTFHAAFERYGLPNSILTDNGAQFAGAHKGISRFERWLMDLDILPVHGRIRHPQTQGKIERFHRTLKDELLRHKTFLDLEDAKVQLDLWRDKYNHIRPHEANGMRPPAEVYIKSSRQLPQRIEPFDYPNDLRLIKVNSWGYVRFAGFQVFLSESMADTYVGFRLSEGGDRFLVYYRNFKIAAFDTQSGQLLDRYICKV